MKHRLLSGLINGPTPPPCFLARLARSGALGNCWVRLDAGSPNAFGLGNARRQYQPVGTNIQHKR